MFRQKNITPATSERCGEGQNLLSKNSAERTSPKQSALYAALPAAQRSTLSERLEALEWHHHQEKAGRTQSDLTPTCLHEIFEQSAAKTPLKIALECAERRWSYAEVDAVANRLARFIRQKGVIKDTFVGLTLTRSEWPIISILAILKAGAAYVPLEPSMPTDRKRYIAEEVGFKLILTDSENLESVRQYTSGDIAVLEEFESNKFTYETKSLPQDHLSAAPNSVCYTLFTSGTTGRPKGVVTEHRNTVHFVNAFNKVCTTNGNDRIFQGFSLGFDGSVEEMWMAFSNGATLVCGEQYTPQFGAELGTFLDQQKISFFSTVPTLLSTLPNDLPHIRQLVVSGEACPPDLVNRWATEDRDMLNVYGPTEATVNTTAGKLQKGKDVTIGRPLPGYDLYILDEKLAPVAKGEKGELYIAGSGISRGYLNQQDLTRKTYITWHNQELSNANAATPEPGTRLYKTGDLVRWNEEQELEFFGRIDSQIKLRGFRIELSEIEAVLLEHENITAAAVKLCEVNQLQHLAAYVLVKDKTMNIDRTDLLAMMRDKLPAYMIPSFLDVLDTFPRVASGKVNMSLLPEPAQHLVSEKPAADQEFTEPENEYEAAIASIWAGQFGVERVGLDQNYFTDLGGHSLLAAQMVTSLYKSLNLSVSVRDIYKFPTIEKLAAHCGELAEAVCKTENENGGRKNSPKQKSLKAWPWSTVILQIIYFLIIVPLLTLPLVLILPLAIETMQSQSTPVILLVLSFALAGGTWAALLIMAIAAKWLLIGRYKPGRYPLWGSFYIRWWIASRLQYLSFISAFNGTPFMSLILRAMGAKVGHHCWLNPSVIYAWDCITIGDHVSIGKDTQMPCLRVEDGHMIVGSLTIGDRCFVGNHSSLGLNAEMEDDARLDDQSLLPDDFKATKACQYRGSPPEKSQVPAPDGEMLVPGHFKLALFGFLQTISATIVTAVTLAPLALATWFVSILVLHYSAMISITAFVISVPLTLFIFTFWSALCKKLVHPNPKPGVYQLYSMEYLRHWLSDLIMKIIKLAGLTIFTTLYLPPWMRMLGAKLGKHTEMSTVWSINPEMITAGDSVFFADGCMVGGTRTHLGRFEVQPNIIGDRSFIGNGAILSSGNCVGSDCLLGVLSSTPDHDKPIEDNTDWLGAPGFQLPHRDKVTCFNEKLTYKPSRMLYLQRAIIDGLRVILPGYIYGGFAILSLLIVLAVYDRYGVWGAYTAIPLLTWVALVLCITSVVGLKWLIMGRFKPVVVPLWSPYVWWNEFINGLYESLLSPWISNFFGTPFAAVMLRMMGCKIGKYCYIETDLFSEFDLVNVGDYSALNAGSVIQNHLFEDRVMKSSYVNIDEGCSVGNMSVVLYDSVMEKGSVLGPMSLLLKGETLPVDQNWSGIPTSRQSS